MGIQLNSYLFRSLFFFDPNTVGERMCTCLCVIFFFYSFFFYIQCDFFFSLLSSPSSLPPTSLLAVYSPHFLMFLSSDLFFFAFIPKIFCGVYCNALQVIKRLYVARFQPLLCFSSFLFTFQPPPLPSGYHFLVVFFEKKMPHRGRCVLFCCTVPLQIKGKLSPSLP